MSIVCVFHTVLQARVHVTHKIYYFIGIGLRRLISYNTADADILTVDIALFSCSSCSNYRLIAISTTIVTLL